MDGSRFETAPSPAGEFDASVLKKIIENPEAYAGRFDTFEGIISVFNRGNIDEAYRNQLADLLVDIINRFPGLVRHFSLPYDDSVSSKFAHTSGFIKRIRMAASGLGLGRPLRGAFDQNAQLQIYSFAGFDKSALIKNHTLALLILDRAPSNFRKYYLQAAIEDFCTNYQQCLAKPASSISSEESEALEQSAQLLRKIVNLSSRWWGGRIRSKIERGLVKSSNFFAVEHDRYTIEQPRALDQLWLLRHALKHT